MSTVRLRMRRWSLRTREEGVRVELRQAVIVLACLIVVFAIFFELGRITRTSPAGAQAYGSQKLPAVWVRAGIPSGLLAAPPIPSLVVAEAPARPAPVSSASAVAGSSSASVERSAAAESTSAPVRSVSPSIPAPVRVTPAPVQAAPAPVSRPRPAPSSSEGTSFDSSG